MNLLKYIDLNKINKWNVKIYRYYDQLTCFEKKIPISGNQINILFKWKDAFDRSIFEDSKLSKIYWILKKNFINI